MVSSRPVIIRLALRSYPSWWRDRYGNDASSTTDDLLSEGRPALVLAAGCFRGALQERLWGPGGSSSPVGPADRLELAVIGTHGAWMLALPFAFLAEVLLIEWTSFDGPLGSVPRPIGVLYGLRPLSVASGFLATFFLGLSLVSSSRRARRTADRGTARLAALPLRSALGSVVALVALIILPPASHHFGWSSWNWDPRFLFGYGLHRPLVLGDDGGLAVSVTLIVLTWTVLIAGPLLAVWGFSAAARRTRAPTSFALCQARLGSLAVVALSVNWVSLLAWNLVLRNENRDFYVNSSLYSRLFVDPVSLVYLLLGLMVLPLAAGLRSSLRSVRAGRDLRRVP